jgi:molybdenum cofactor synthesis domain-containing protein
MVVSVNVSENVGTSKHPVPEAEVNMRGLVGDAHAGDWHRQVSLLAAETVERFSREAGRPIRWGEFAENITTRGLDLERAGPLDRFRVADAELEVTQVGKECHGAGCAIFQEIGRCVMPREGIFCRVISEGAVKPGDAITHVPRVLRFRIITLSDRASRGVYEDRSGPRIRECLESFFRSTRWRTAIETRLLPDDAEQLRAELVSAREAGVDVVFTTGGTGIGPRDITPEVVTALADKVIPGIMEHIRVKFGADKPNALLSRSVAAVMARTLVYALPGSVKAVDEYLGEISKTLEHCVCMLHGLDTHESRGG